MTHHYIIYCCCKVLGCNWKTLPYALLVDDLAIGDESVDKIYMTVIKDLGLVISLKLINEMDTMSSQKGSL